jgi:hypothetical protein
LCGGCGFGGFEWSRCCCEVNKCGETELGLGVWVLLIPRCYRWNLMHLMLLKGNNEEVAHLAYKNKGILYKALIEDELL